MDLAAQQLNMHSEVDYKLHLEDQEFRKQDEAWALRLGAEFVKHYPGHGWEVHMDIKNGICNIFNRQMSPKAGYRWRLQEINTASISQDVRRIGGEILERFGLSREVFEADKIREIQATTHGNAKVDLS